MSNFTLTTFHTFDDVLLSDLKSLMEQCPDYEPILPDSEDIESNDDFYVTSIMAYADTPKGRKVAGFASYLTEFVSEEVSILIAPEFRRMGLATLIIDHILSSDNTMTRFLLQLPDELINSSLNHGKAKTEYLMSIDYDYYLKNIANKPAASPAAYNNCQCCFSDDYFDYLVYINDDDEPVAVCSLDYQSSFTNVYDVVVDEHLRGQGLGYTLISNMIHAYFCEDNYNDNDYYFKTNPLVLNVNSSNAAAYNLYKKCGFTEVSHIDYYYMSNYGSEPLSD